MTASVWASVIAVVGTLSGAMVAGGLQGRVSRSARQAARRDAHWSAVVAGVTVLVSALADHRRAMWVREDLRLAGARRAYTDARADSHRTRSALSAPLVTVSILAPSLTAAAQEAARATCALRGAPDHDTLGALRQQALTATNHLIAVAGDLFSNAGCGNPNCSRA